MAQRRGPNGRSSIYQEPDGSWRGEVSFGTDPLTGKRLRRKVRGKTQALVAAKVRALERDRDAGLRPTSWTVASWLDEWIKSRALSVRVRTVQGYRVDQKHIVRTLGPVQLARLTPEQVEDLYRACQRAGLSPGSVHHVYRTPSAAMQTAVDRGYAVRNPVKLAYRPRYAMPVARPFDEEQARKLVRAAGSVRNGARWLIQLECGLRQGEVLGLRWDTDLDLGSGVLWVQEQLQPIPVSHGCRSPCGMTARRCPRRIGGGFGRVPVKSASAVRRFKLSQPLIVALRTHRAAQSSERHCAGPSWREGGWIFADELGRPYGAKRDLAEWTTLCEIAGVPRRRTHDLRHSYATFLLSNGVPDTVVARMLGHSSTALVARYGHMVDETHQRVADVMSRLLWLDE